MEASLVGAIVSGILQVGLERMASKEFINLFRERKNDDELTRRLRRHLLAIKPVLDDAENRFYVSEHVKEWLFEIQGSVHEACDLVDKINTEALRVKVETEYQSSSGQHALSSREFLNEMMPKMEELVLSLEGFQQHIPQLGLQLKHEEKKQWYRDPSTSLVEHFVYGRELEKENIIQLLLSEDEDKTGDNITVIPIVGLGGIGKTTLAQLVYDDENVKAHFDTMAWVCISNPYDSMKVTRELLEELGIPGSDSSQSFNSLQVKLKLGLEQRKFLIVLDDVWTRDYNDWSRLRISLGGGLHGSKIIVTTRDEQVALMMGKKGSIHHLSLMSEEASWSLFKKHALETRDGNMDFTNFEEMGKRIVEKCKGLPLAIKTIAGLLRSRITMEEWRTILKSDVWDLSTVEDELDILPALRLSYIHLPSILKQCFAYCALFPKDYNFKKEEIVHLWLANDLLEKTRGNKTMEEMGEVYLHELKMRSLVQHSANNSFCMHDLVNDLARSIFGRYYYQMKYHQKGHGIMTGMRHFSYYMDTYDEFSRFNLLNEAKSLRTFLPLKAKGTKSSLKSWGKEYCSRLSKKFLYDVLPTFESLRYLSLSCYRIFQLPESIGNLKQLHHLDLSFTHISSLPDCICTLYNLQSLLLTSCSELKELPLELGKLIKLRYLDISDVPLLKMPTNIGRLRGLQVLTSFVLDDNGTSRIKELGNFPNIRKKLIISGLENVSDSMDALLAKMKEKKHLEKLILKWNYGFDISPVAADVLNYLEPHPSIKHLEIDGYCGTRFPSWLGLSSSFSHLVSLCLNRCENCFQLPAVGQLVTLKTLKISRLSRIISMDKEMYGDIDGGIRPFQSLEVLRIEDMAEWKIWFIPDSEVFTDLEELYIINCPELIGNFPRKLLSLRKLKISSCEKLVPNGRLSIFNPIQGDLIQRFPSLGVLNLSLLNLEGLFPELEELTSLQKLRLEHCVELSPLPMSSLPASLKTLEFYDLCNLQLETGSSLTPSHSSIERLILLECNNLRVLPLGFFPMLKRLEIMFSASIEALSLPPGNDCVTSLQALKIWGCDNFLSFPAGGFPAPNLRHIELWECKNLMLLPEHMQSFSSLEYLEISNCSEIECFPEGGPPSSLQTLRVCYCEKLVANRSQWGLERLPSLLECEIKGTLEAESLVEDLMLPFSLEFLILQDHKSLKTLNHGGLQYLTSLISLSILDCPLLQSLPQEGLPNSLFCLEVSHCPLLKPRLEWQKGGDWPMVEHLASVIVDDELVP